VAELSVDVKVKVVASALAAGMLTVQRRSSAASFVFIIVPSQFLMIVN
jgi:hypothetical protein